MSEYQYYEFRALDRPLTRQEQQAVSGLSSRVSPHPRRAVFVYNYSDFPGNPLEILTKYYDGLFYIANWGSVQLAFRLPKSLVDVGQLNAYALEDEVTVATIGDYVVVNMEVHDEDGFDAWIEGEDYLDSLISLREDIMRGDYRVLYLAWLAASGMYIDENPTEPPVPAGLKNLNSALEAFRNLFDIDKHLLAVAIQASVAPRKTSATDIQKAIGQLSEKEKGEWLTRLAQNEPLLGLAFQQRLKGDTLSPKTAKRRTASELWDLAEASRNRAQKEARARAEAKRIRDLEALAAKEEETWAKITALIEEGKAKPYDEAVMLLVSLHNLAVYQGKEAAYEAKIKQIRQQYSRRSALLRRLDRAALP